MLETRQTLPVPLPQPHAWLRVTLILLCGLDNLKEPLRVVPRRTRLQERCFRTASSRPLCFLYSRRS